MTADVISNLTINWSRSILINAAIDDDLVKRLTPEILRLRQESDNPITVGIDSPGGSLSSLDVLIGLLSGPNQDGKKCQLITVATHRAYSAAANLLAFGDYAVVFKHSKILFHDVRYSEVEDVTPEVARTTARVLQNMNDHFSLRLAKKIVSRLIWTYIDLRPKFEHSRKIYRQRYGRYAEKVSSYIPDSTITSIDLPSFAIALFAKLSGRNDGIITNVMQRMDKWISMHPGGHLKLPHLWPGQNPPVGTTGLGGFLLGMVTLCKASSSFFEAIAFTTEFDEHTPVQ